MAAIRCFLSSMLASPVRSWRNPHKFSKYAVQLGHIAESYRERHVAKREVGFGQQSFGTMDPLRQDVLVGRKANCVLERSDEVVWAQSCHGRQIGYRDFMRDLSVNKILHLP